VIPAEHAYEVANEPKGVTINGAAAGMQMVPYGDHVILVLAFPLSSTSVDGILERIGAVRDHEEKAS